jgi:hypothetical protein
MNVPFPIRTRRQTTTVRGRGNDPATVKEEKWTQSKICVSPNHPGRVISSFAFGEANIHWAFGVGTNIVVFLTALSPPTANYWTLNP